MYSFDLFDMKRIKSLTILSEKEIVFTDFILNINLIAIGPNEIIINVYYTLNKKIPYMQLHIRFFISKLHWLFNIPL